MTSLIDLEEPQTPRAPPSPKALKTPKAQKEQHAKAPKEPRVMYLGVSVNHEALLPIMLSPSVEDLIVQYPGLKQKDEFHATLHFFKGKDTYEKKNIVDEL